MLNDVGKYIPCMKSKNMTKALYYKSYKIHNVCMYVFIRHQILLFIISGQSGFEGFFLFTFFKCFFIKDTLLL